MKFVVWSSENKKNNTQAVSFQHELDEFIVPHVLLIQLAKFALKIKYFSMSFQLFSDYFTLSMIFCANSSASCSVLASLYIRIMGSVFDLRRCTQPCEKSILTPSMSVIVSFE